MRGSVGCSIMPRLYPGSRTHYLNFRLKQVQLQLKETYLEAVRFGINGALGLGGWFDLVDRWFRLEQEDKTLA